jgi:hypothetical protein
MRVIPRLRELRGPIWRDLIDHILHEDTPIEEQLGFVLMMVDLCSCSTCNSYSYRAMRGCTTCACSAISRFREDDAVLVKKVKSASKRMSRVYKEVPLVASAEQSER